MINDEALMYFPLLRIARSSGIIEIFRLQTFPRKSYEDHRYKVELKSFRQGGLLVVF